MSGSVTRAALSICRAFSEAVAERRVGAVTLEQFKVILSSIENFSKGDHSQSWHVHVSESDKSGKIFWLPIHEDPAVCDSPSAHVLGMVYRFAESGYCMQATAPSILERSTVSAAAAVPVRRGDGDQGTGTSRQQALDGSGRLEGPRAAALPPSAAATGNRAVSAPSSGLLSNASAPGTASEGRSAAVDDLTAAQEAAAAVIAAADDDEDEQLLASVIESATQTLPNTSTVPVTPVTDAVAADGASRTCHPATTAGIRTPAAASNVAGTPSGVGTLPARPPPVGISAAGRAGVDKHKSERCTALDALQAQFGGVGSSDDEDHDANFAAAVSRRGRKRTSLTVNRDRRVWAPSARLTTHGPADYLPSSLSVSMLK